ncbi:MAG TPA: dihydrodipicolinate synthase family protein [Chloroflexota bacterium]|nr:dihydrodipicolinate synthase family protein [Chloroflexota bacterium]
MVTHHKPLTGVIAILVTPFTEDDRLDLLGLARVAEYTIGLGVHGIGIGLASEYLALSDAECVAVARTLVETARDRLPVMMSCGRPSSAATIGLARDIAATGVDALMVLPPYVLQPGGAGLVAHYQAVAGAVATPIVVQDAPQMSGASLSAELLAGLVREVPSIRYLKIEALPSVPKIAELARLLAGDPKGAEALIGGAGGMHLVDELRHGARATMPGCSYADIFVRVWDAFQAGDLATARRVLYRALPHLLYASQSFSALVGTQKEWLRRVGVIESARLRAPAEQLSDEIYTEFAELLGEAR